MNVFSCPRVLLCSSSLGTAAPVFSNLTGRQAPTALPSLHSSHLFSLSSKTKPISQLLTPREYVKPLMKCCGLVVSDLQLLLTIFLSFSIMYI